jgi:hypothetical protein
MILGSAAISILTLSQSASLCNATVDRYADDIRSMNRLIDAEVYKGGITGSNSFNVRLKYFNGMIDPVVIDECLEIADDKRLELLGYRLHEYLMRTPDNKALLHLRNLIRNFDSEK